MTDATDRGPVLVVGATGNLGGLVVDELLVHGRPVRALVRPATDATKLEQQGVDIVRGDMLDLESLVAAMTGVDAVITTAAGYTRRSKNAEQIDTIGNANLAEAAARAGVRRFVLTSILTCDQTPGVPHFWHKHLAELKLEEFGVPFVALRPGAFLDQAAQMGGDPFEKKRFIWLGRKTTALTFVLTTDLARYLVEAVDVDVSDGERIDIGWDRPVSMQDIAAIAGDVIGTKVSARGLPIGLVNAATTVLGRFVPMIKDMGAMVQWFETGNYVADTTRQAKVFGPVPIAEDAVGRLAESLGHRRRN